MSRLETTSNVVVVLAAAIVIGNNLYSRFVPPRSRAESGLSGRLVGKTLDLRGSLPVGHQGSVTAFIAQDCHYCRESIEFYRRVAKLTQGGRPCDVKLLAVAPREREKRDSFQAFLADQNLQVDGADVVSFASVGVQGTPTLVLRDSSQVVKNVWVGFLAPSRQNEVLERVKSLCGN